MHKAELKIDLRVPFDPEHPNASVDALLNQVCGGLQRYLNVLNDIINQAAITIKYAIKVQKLPLDQVEIQAQKAIQMAVDLQSELTVEKLSDFDNFEENVVPQFIKLATEEQSLMTEVQRAIQKRQPVGSEINLIQMIDESESKRVDLRGLIIKMLEKSDEIVDLDDLMGSITSLFKKNQISIFIVAQAEDGREKLT